MAPKALGSSAVAEDFANLWPKEIEMAVVLLWWHRHWSPSGTHQHQAIVFHRTKREKDRGREAREVQKAHGFCGHL